MFRLRISGFFSFGIILFSLLFCAGCSQVSMPMGSSDVDTPVLLTGSITTPSEIANTDIDDADRAIIATTLDNIIQETASTAKDPTPWSNAVSGNSGYISSIDTHILAETSCIGFETTANTIAGIRNYKGTACRDAKQAMHVTSLAAEDS